MKHYAIVYFGSPSGRPVRRTGNLDAAIKAARNAKGSGSCTSSRVYECATAEMAKTADTSIIRDGEHVVFVA